MKKILLILLFLPLIGFGQGNTNVSFNKYKYIIISEISITTYRTGINHDMWDKPAERHLKKYLEKIEFIVLDSNQELPEDLQINKANALYCYLNLVENSNGDKLEVNICFKTDINNIFFMCEGNGIFPKQAIKSALKVLSNHGKSFVPKTDYNTLNINECIEGDCINGNGIFNYDNGDVYNGEFKKGRRDGKGIYTWVNGDVYDGEWKNNSQHGHGIQTYADGEILKGEFKKGELSWGGDLIGKHSFSLSEEQNKFPDYIVLNIDSLSKNEAYNKTLDWIGLPSFSDQKKIISQRKNESIKIQGLNKIDINSQKFDIRYFVEFRFKNNRIKFDVLDAEIYIPDQVKTKIKWGNVLLNTFGLMMAIDSHNNKTGLTYINTGSTTKDELLPGGWEKLYFTYSEIIESNDRDDKNITFQILNSFTIIARDLTTHLNMKIEKEDDW